MKKLVAISVLLAGLAAAVFAQDEGKWKVGFMAQLVTDMLKVTSAKVDGSYETTGSPTGTFEYGNINKGSIGFFNNTKSMTNLDDRLLLSISNSGEGYDVYASITTDNDWATRLADKGLSVWDILQGSVEQDWYLKGTAGIFNAQVGTAGYGGFVSPQSAWNSWFGWMEICKFGVYRTDGFIVSDEFRTWPEWGSIFALGTALGDNFKFSIGYKLNPGWWGGWRGADDPWANKSSINASFLISGRPVEAISFDVFYSVYGKDDDTLTRGSGGKWGNIIGAFVGVNAIQNLGLSLGYTANFNAYEAGKYIDPADTDVNPVKTQPVTYTAPFYSGVDIRLSYSGIDKIGLLFNNNLSFAGAKGIKPETGYNKEFNYALSERGTLGEGESEDWFHYHGEIKASFALVENLGLTLQLGDKLGVKTYNYSLNSVTRKTTTTDNQFQAVLSAEYGIGSVTVGLGIFFNVASTAFENESSASSVTTTAKVNTSVTTFGIPLMFKVAF